VTVIHAIYFYQQLGSQHLSTYLGRPFSTALFVPSIAFGNLMSSELTAAECRCSELQKKIFAIRLIENVAMNWEQILLSSEEHGCGKWSCSSLHG
jgi:hypothetical protein